MQRSFGTTNSRAGRFTGIGLGIFFLLATAAGCTWNPFSHGKINSGGLADRLRGRVALTSGKSPKGVYVWLEGANIGTFSDSTGQFTLSLPSGPQLGGFEGLSGVYRLFFFIANFKLESVKVALQNGQFVYGEQSLDEKGYLRQTVYLTQILRITTQVYPASVPSTYKHRIWIKTTVVSLQDTVKVVFPRSDGTFLGGVFLKNLETGAVTVLESAFGPDVRYEIDVGPNSQSLVRIFTLPSYPLNPGRYRAIPYLFVLQKGLPSELVQSLGDRVTELSPEYLKIPFRREGGFFQVTGL